MNYLCSGTFEFVIVKAGIFCSDLTCLDMIFGDLSRLGGEFLNLMPVAFIVEYWLLSLILVISILL